VGFDEVEEGLGLGLGLYLLDCNDGGTTVEAVEGFLWRLEEERWPGVKGFGSAVEVEEKFSFLFFSAELDEDTVLRFVGAIFFLSQS